MRKLTSLFVLLLLVLSPAKAQNQWAFMGGYLDAGNYANLNYGGFNPNNKPATREHCAAGIYNNKIWTFGGAGGSTGSDIWCYDISQQAWGFIEEPGANENYANQGNEDPWAHPGNRSRMAYAMDNQGNLWFFGGETWDLGWHTGWNDFWKYNTNTQNWTWLGGGTTHSGTGGPNFPRSRYRARAWFDAQGNYWLFGGIYFDGSTYPNPMNDLWKYNVGTQQWTCESGDCNHPHQPNSPSGVYPSSPGQTSSTYKPRARGDYGYWVDNSGNFWIYGGANGEVHNGGQVLGDTWKYNPNTHEWTLMQGDNSIASTDPNNSSFDPGNITNPGHQSEPVCWLGNDGLPWMRLANHSIWKFSGGQWQNQYFETATTWTGPNVQNGQWYVDNPNNQPASHYSTFNHIKTATHVYLYNGYGRGANGTDGPTGALWRYSIPAPCNLNSVFVSNQSCTMGNQSFALTVNGTNTNGGYYVTGFPNGYTGNTTGTYGTAVSFSGIPSASFPLNLTVRDNSGACSYNVTINAVSCASPNLQLSITQDNFVPNGASPYTTSTREITIQNTGSATAQNISLQLGLSPYYSYSAMQLANVQVLNASNVPISGATVTGTTWTGSNDPTGFPCGTNASNYKSTIQVSIPSLAIGAIAKVRVTADHCMANFEHTTTSYYTWNYWGAEAAYQDGIGMSYSTARLNNNAAQALDNYFWTAYQAPYTPPTVTSGSNLFTVELGSGTYGNPSNYQDRGSSYPYSRARVDLVLPGNVVFNTGSLSDIVGEYALVNGSSSSLATVTASSIQWGPTLSNGDQTYYILFPPSQYLPIRRIFLSLRVMSYPVGVHDISARIRTTFDYHYATDTYGWLPASPNYSYRTQSGAFPVDLLSFTGGIFNENAELSWITGSESNNAGFEVEKSLNGNDFQKIGFVEGAGTTSSAQNYSFTDYNFSSRAWYRLNQVDYDGKATPSNIVELSSESLLATISPNPLENGIANISLPVGESRKITVYNALGEKVLETSVDTNLYTLNLSAQSEGIYSVVCLVDGKKQVLKVKR